MEPSATGSAQRVSGPSQFLSSRADALCRPLIFIACSLLFSADVGSFLIIYTLETNKKQKSKNLGPKDKRVGIERYLSNTSWLIKLFELQMYEKAYIYSKSYFLI